MTTVLCTLYNSLYLDKGLVLYDSLCECAKDFKLYVLCMDDKCYEVLTDLKQEHHIPIRLSDFEAGDEALLAAKSNRSMGEYCWTCSSSFIRYILKHFNEGSCTYIDADMYFYNEPQVLINEMLAVGKSVMVVPHRFCKEKESQAATAGLYCVEFNTFLNNKESFEVLEYWRGRCLDCCSNLGDGVHWGDQKYLEELVAQFDCVHVCENVGAGVAPWNIYSYSPVEEVDKKDLIYMPTGKRTKLFFYHYQSIIYINNSTVVVSLRNTVNRKFVESLYKPYLQEIKLKKEILSKVYGITSLIHGHPARFSYFNWLKEMKLGQWLLYLKRKLNGMVIVKL